MQLFKRGLLAATVAVVATIVLGGTASATISPNPYTTSIGSGIFNTIDSLGNGLCNLSNVTASATGTTGAITGFVASGCSGTILSARYNKIITISSNLATRTLSVVFAVLLVNFLRGSCLYQGTMSGTPNGTDTVTLAGALPLFRALSGVCSPSKQVNMTLRFPGATIS